MVPHKITKKVRNMAVGWANGLFTHAELSRDWKVSGNTVYRMLASALAEELKTRNQ